MENAITAAAPVAVGFSSAAGFELLQRQAKMLSSSDLVPKEYKGNLANTCIALEMANRMGANPLMVMQSLYIVHGKPSWSSQFLIAALNSTGRFSPMRFDISEPEAEKEVSATITEWKNGNKVTNTVKEKIKNRSCVAWCIEKSSGERLESPPVSLEMAVIEGWFSKSGSKWQTMPDLMLRYRAATFFCRLYAPEVTMGFQTAEEVQDVIDVTPPTTTTTDAQNIMDRFKSEEEIIEQTGEVVITAEEIKEVKAEVKTDEQKSLINDDDFIDPPKICSLCKKKGGKHSDSCPNATPETVE